MNRIDIFKLMNLFLIEMLLAAILIGCCLFNSSFLVVSLVFITAINELFRLNVSLYSIEIYERTDKFNEAINTVATVLRASSSIMSVLTVIVTLLTRVQ